MRRPAAGPDPTPDPVVAWRSERLRASGFADELARQIAGDRSYDLHAVLELVDRRCPPELAARILAPVEQ
jgi:hypothetical protein